MKNTPFIIINNIKNFIINLIPILIKIINNRLNQDCFGKRLYRNIKNINIKLPWFIKGKQDILPICTFIFANFYLFSILYLIFLSILTNYYYI